MKLITAKEFNHNDTGYIWTDLSLPRSKMGSCSLKLRASGWTSSRGRPFTCKDFNNAQGYSRYITWGRCFDFQIKKQIAPWSIPFHACNKPQPWQTSYAQRPRITSNYSQKVGGVHNVGLINVSRLFNQEWSIPGQTGLAPWHRLPWLSSTSLQAQSTEELRYFNNLDRRWEITHSPIDTTT